MVLTELNPALPTALWVVPVFSMDGVGRHVLDVAGVGLPGWNLVVVCPPGVLADRLLLTGTRVVSGPFGASAGLIASMRLLRRAVRKFSPTVVHAHLSYADVVSTCLLVFNRRITLVTTEHGIAANDLVYHGSRMKSRLRALMHRVRLHRTNVLIAVSRATRRAMIAKWHPAQEIHVVPNGVELVGVSAGSGGEVEDMSAGGPRVLSLCRLAPEKRLSDLIAAFAELHVTHPEATLTLAGTGSQKNELVGIVSSLGLESSIFFPGFVNAAEAMRHADVIVQLSVWENCSYTLLDAVAAGLGVVATPVGGNVEILPARCLVEATDSRAITEAILSQAMNHELRPQLDSQWPDVRSMSQLIVDSYAASDSR